MYQERENKFSIEITHVTNPSRFFFREIDNDDLRLQEKIDKIELELLDFLKNDENDFYAGFDFEYQPKVDDVVAFFDHPRGKWIRCIVDEFANYSNVLTAILWSIDYGFPFQITVPYEGLRKVSAYFRSKNVFIQQGALRIIPSENRFNVVNKKTMYCSDWKSFPSRAFIENIEDCTNVKFLPNGRKLNNTFFGDLLFGKKEKSMSDAIVERGFGKRPDTSNEFDSKFMQLDVHFLARYNDNSRTGGVFKQSYGVPKKYKLRAKHQKELKDEVKNSNIPYDEKVDMWLIRCEDGDDDAEDEVIGSVVNESVSDFDAVSSVSAANTKKVVPPISI